MARRSLLSALLAPAFSLALGCGDSGGTDGGATVWYWDSSTVDTRHAADVPVEPADLRVDRVYPSAVSDADLDFDALPVCVENGPCAADCVQVCGLHSLGRMACSCEGGALRCDDCFPLPSARPLIPTVVAGTCGPEVVGGQACARQGDACLAHTEWDWPDGCLCWPTDLGLRWDCLNVLHWFVASPDGGP